MIESDFKTGLLATAFLMLLGLPSIALASGNHEGDQNGAEAHHEAGREVHAGNDEHHGGDGHGDGHGHAHGSGHGHDGGESLAFGKPAAPGDADRTVTIKAKDAMTFTPSTIRVRKGETVRFVVKNVGQLQHSFTLGTPKSQRHHEKEMQDMARDRMASHMADDPTGMVLQPGETGTLTWRFTKAQPVQFACHIPGHYPAGMKGSIQVAG